MDRSSRNNNNNIRGCSGINNARAAAAAANDPNDPADEAPVPDAAGSLSNNGVARAPEPDEDEEPPSPLLASLLDHLVELAHQAGFAEELIEVSKAKLLLEATAGQVSLAAQLYWDDVLARTHEQPVAAAAPSRKAPPAAGRRRLETQYDQPQPQLGQYPLPDAAFSSRPWVAPSNNDAANNRRDVAFGRGRLARQAAVAAVQALAQQNQDRRGHPNQRMAQPLHARSDGLDSAPGRQSDAESEETEHDEPEEEDAMEDEHGEDGPQPRLVQARGMEASVSISDDEAAAGMLRTVKAVTQHVRKNRAVKRPSSDFFPSSVCKRQKLTGNRYAKREEDDEDDEEYSDGYLSDNDWIWESLSTTPRESIPPVPPMDFLWGVPATLSESGDDDATLKISNKDSRKKGGRLKDEENGAKEDEGNGDVKEDEGNGDVKEDEGNDDAKEKERNVAIVAMDVDAREVARAVSTKSSDSTDNNANKGKPDPDESSNGEDDDEKAATIPVTWLRAGFGFADGEKTGLACKQPNEDDIGYLLWKQQIPLSAVNARSGQCQPQPPYHCQSVTLLPAIVTALMQAGVTVVQEANVSSPHVTCHTTQVPYYQLDAKTRPREWERRLVDALTALLVVAAQASKQRKAKALERAQALEQQQVQQKKQKQRASGSLSESNAETTERESPILNSSAKKSSADAQAGSAAPSFAGTSDNSPSAKWQKLWGKLQLCPTCWWEKTDTNNTNGNGPTGQTHVLPNPEEAFTIPLSYTHICDLRSYVKSNLDCFLATGGCALFLETILRIHGKGAVQRMVTLARMQQKGFSKNGKLHPLISCTCQERFQNEQRHQRVSSWPGACKKNGNEKNCQAKEPLNDCASVELVSLLLTGHVYCTWQGWSTSMSNFANLGIGVLTDKPGEVSRGLTRPEKPVWIVKGPSQYSVIWLNERNSVDVLESRGFVANMTHWSCWYGATHHSLTNFRFFGGKEGTSEDEERSRMDVEEEKSFKAMEDPKKGNMPVTLKVLEERRRKLVQAAADRKSVEIVDENYIFTQSDLDRVKVHPEDSQYYDNFRLWRFDILPPQSNEAKPHGENWVPFHRLDKTNKQLVENKLGPKLAVILRTRWPGAQIDRMEPSKPLPLI